MTDEITTAPVDLYRCAACKRTFKNLDEAEHCCPPVKEQYYQCLLCGTLHREEIQATECCDDVERDW